MAMGRGSAVVAVVLLLCLVLGSEMAQATTYTVGDAAGWTFNTVSWPNRKRFRAGDTLVFKYAPGTHNVVVVNKVGYDTCRAPKGATAFKSGKDQIKLAKGPNYFICTFLGHCESGMKIAINAA